MNTVQLGPPELMQLSYAANHASAQTSGQSTKAKPFLAKKTDETGRYIAMKYPIVIGSDQLASHFGLTSMPMSILIDRDGMIAVFHAGVVGRASFEANIHKLLPQTSPR